MSRHPRSLHSPAVIATATKAEQAVRRYICYIQLEVKAKLSCAGAFEHGIFPCMRFRLAGGKSIAPRAVVAAGILSAFLWTLTLTVSPSLHERIHSDANRAEHSCAVTLIGSGSCNHSAPVPLVSAPVPAVQFSTIPALHPLWVPSPFLGACIFEHAPPAK
jgi:hypothetical protein